MRKAINDALCELYFGFKVADAPECVREEIAQWIDLWSEYRGRHTHLAAEIGLKLEQHYKK